MGSTRGSKKLVKDGNVFTWTWNDFVLIQDREFIIRQDGTWDGVAGVYNGGTARVGTAFDAKVSKAVEGENFLVKVGGTYDITFSINGVTGVQTLTINE